MEELKSMLNRMVKALESDVKRLEGKVDALMKLPDQIAVENTIKTMAWAMDSGDKELWMSIWDDDIRYLVPQYDLEIKGKEALSEFAEGAIFTREERRFSALTNVIVEVAGDTAKGRDYYMHYGFPLDAESGKAAEARTCAEGTHFYEFRKHDGAWKITRFEVYLNRRQEDSP
ncbi:MAG TPA: nuclear transport factor 2 family protein [Dehalococcoidia bacterium]|nr:nuclear transport factor 2 family protein [Dehalococcoidia bacterium]